MRMIHSNVAKKWLKLGKCGQNAAKISHIGGQTSTARNIPHSLWVVVHAINYVKLELIDKVNEQALPPRASD